MSGSHIVQAGDTLSGIAARYSLKLEDLVRWNKIKNPDQIQVGQEIELSGHEPATETMHTVVAGDTVSEIAEKYGATVEAIAKANNLTNVDQIQVGQQLKVPLPTS